MRIPWSRRFSVALVAAVPLVASIAIFGGSTPASAWVVSSACATYQVCYYGNTDYAPTSEILNIGQQDTPDWVQITPGASVACTQGKGNGKNWNDCASSVKDKMTYYLTCAWENVDYTGEYRLFGPGYTSPNLGQIGFNDEISSTFYISPGGAC
jgi:hypothetical protein